MADAEYVWHDGAVAFDQPNQQYVMNNEPQTNWNGVHPGQVQVKQEREPVEL